MADHERVDDLVKRLREAAALPNGLYAEAADEIERLRAENAAIRTVADEAELNREGIKAAHADLRKLRAEVQMLRATVVDSARDVDAATEIAQLRKDAERYRWLREEAFQATAARIVQMLPGHMDAEIDAAMQGANA